MEEAERQLQLSREAAQGGRAQLESLAVTVRPWPSCKPNYSSVSLDLREKKINFERI